MAGSCPFDGISCLCVSHLWEIYFSHFSYQIVFRQSEFLYLKSLHLQDIDYIVDIMFILLKPPSP